MTVAATCVAAPAAHAADSVFGGTTKDREPFVLKADKRAGKVRSVVIGLEAECPGGAHYPIWGTYKVGRAAPGFSPDGVLIADKNNHGVFDGKIVSSEPVENGGGTLTIDITARLTRRSARGMLGASVAIIDDAGQTVATCTAPATSWAATRRPGVVYGGASAQDEPVVMRLDEDRRKVADFLFSWHAPCQPDGALRLPDGLTNFRVGRSGSFGGKPHDQFASNTGGQNVLDYGLNGTIHKHAAKGTVNAQVTANDAGGAQQHQCSTGDVAWRVASG
jgi:hypothetical protein